MKVKILYLVLFAFFLAITIGGLHAHNSTISCLGILSLAVWENSATARFTHKRIREESEKQAAALKEAGLALTDTMKILFDSLKKLNTEKSRLQAKLADVNTRIHNLEQHWRKMAVPSVLKRTEEITSGRKPFKVLAPDVRMVKAPSAEKEKYTDAVKTQKQP